MGRISIRMLISAALLLILYAGFQGGKYFMNNRFQELGIALTFGLYFYGALFTAFVDRDIRWGWWFWSAPFLAGYVMLSSSIIFALNAGVGVFPSLFAAREFLIVFLAPTLYFLFRLGVTIEQLEQVFVASLVVIVFNYLFHYFRIDLEAAYFSTGYMSYLVTHDEWRGYRLKPPTFALLILSAYCPMRLVQPASTAQRLGLMVVFALVLYIWSLIMARSQMATLVLAMMLYPVFFSRPNRSNLLLLVLPMNIFLLLAMSGALIEGFMNAEGAEVRARSYLAAFEVIGEKPLLGYGQSSGYSKTYQDIFGPKFFPSDLGLVGVTFKYGFIGLGLYLFFHFFVAYRLLRVNWEYRRRYRQHNPVIWSMFILMTALTINLVLNPGLAYMQGLTTASWAIALTACHFERERTLRLAPN